MRHRTTFPTAPRGSSACPTLPPPRRLTPAFPVRLLGARVMWSLLWDVRRPSVRHLAKSSTAPQEDLRGRLE